MDLIKKIDAFLENSEKNAIHNVGDISKSILYRPANSKPDTIKTLITSIEKIENNDNLEWLYILEILKFLESCNYSPESSVILSLLNCSFKRIKVFVDYLFQI
jgi:hypothetical protein